MIKTKTICFSCVIALLLPFFSSSKAQEATPRTLIEVGENILVSKVNTERPLVEPQVVANPQNPNHLLATAIVSTNPPFSTQQDCATFVSFDGGKTWAQHLFGFERCGDPWVVLRADGTAVFSGLAARGEIRIAHSTDGGRSWSTRPVDLGRGHDHQTMTVDTSKGKFAGSIYLVSGKLQRDTAGNPAASVFVARSADGGRSFQQTANVVPSNMNNNALTPVVLSDGTLIVPFIDYQHHAEDSGGAGMLERRRVWALVSTDGGQTFSAPKFVSEACGSGGGFASLAADTSAGTFRDRLYLTCVNRDKNTVYVHHSADRGERWSAAIRVDRLAENVVFRRTPSIAVNKDGVLGITWYDRRREANRECQYISFAASFDGGKTFLPEVRVSTAPSCPDVPRNGAVAQRWAAGGDYSGLVATGDRLFHIVWSDSRNGIYQLWTAQSRVNTAARQN
jgi:photosystem II stability/assembly factor-like uncharacterized protein